MGGAKPTAARSPYSAVADGGFAVGMAMPAWVSGVYGRGLASKILQLVRCITSYPVG
ncbi:protein of unknown function [Bradyrhizobium sp. ORS 285]|nr:protein of unknown function [Bradyrhizobium sp. ORS 285]